MGNLCVSLPDIASGMPLIPSGSISSRVYVQELRSVARIQGWETQVRQLDEPISLAQTLGVPLLACVPTAGRLAFQHAQRCPSLSAEEVSSGDDFCPNGATN